MTPVVGIRANAGAAVGFGHVRRCVSLAEALFERGADVTFFANPESDSATWLPRHPARAARLEIVPAEEAATLSITKRRAAEMKIAALVIDSYDTTGDAMRGAAVPITAIVDAPPPEALPAALIVNTAADAAAIAHPLAPGGRALLGPKFALLRCELSRLNRRSISDEVSNVLVLAGGSDAAELSLLFVDAVRTALPKTTISVVAGPYFTAALTEALRAQAVADPLITIVKTPSSMRALMVGADLALTAGGQTTYELAAAGVPACAVRVALNQTANLQGLRESGTLLWIGDAGDQDLRRKAEHAVRRLAADMALRQSMSQAGRTLVDGRGADRVAEAILGLCA